MISRNLTVETTEQRDYLVRWLGKQPTPFQCDLGPVKASRSLSANNRLWLLHTKASEVTGYSPEEMHDFALCRHFGYSEVERKDLLTGEISMHRVPLKRSSARDKKEFAAFMEATEIWYGQEFGCWLEIAA